MAYEKFHEDMSHTTHRPLIKGKENMERFTAYALYGSSSRTLRLALELVLIQSLLISALPLKMLMLLLKEPLNDLTLNICQSYRHGTLILALGSSEDDKG
jgi:hypothetical protein